MEFARSGDDDSLKEDQKRSDHDEYSVDHGDGDDDDGNTHQKQEDHTTIVEDSPMNNTNTEKSVAEAGPSTSSAKKKEVDEKLESTKVEMGEVREENQRLKMSLNKIMNEYRVLQMKFHDILKQETRNSEEKGNDDNSHQEMIEEPELVSLSLGRVPRNEEKSLVKVPNKTKLMKDDEEFNREELTLGLDCKFETSKSGSTNEALPNSNNNQSPGNSSEVVAKEEAGETCPPSKALKTVRDNNNAEDEVSQQNPAKKARVCVRARCDTPTMNDGCQWRKYGQKIAKGNPCPRAYYRCTVAPSCPVRKQVQRCADDMSILITTYEGTHNHPLPVSATAMASTTSAAASMLLSGSSTSTSSNNLHHHHPLMNLYDPSQSLSKHLYLSNNNPSALSSSSSSSLPSHPTITLDLTSNPSATSSSSSPFVRFSSNNYNQLHKYPYATSLNFGYNHSSSSSESNNATMSWNNNNNNNGFLNYGTDNRNMNNILSNVNFGRQVQAQQLENFYQSIIMQRNNNNNNNSVPGALPETIAAATKAITADPSFQSALAAALSSFIGSTQQQGNNNNNNHHQGVLNGGDGENLGLKKKLAELFPVAASSSSSSAAALNSSKMNNNVIGCGASSLLNKTGPVKAQNGGLMFLPTTPSLPFSASKSASASPAADDRDNNNN